MFDRNPELMFEKKANVLFIEKNALKNGKNSSCVLDGISIFLWNQLESPKSLLQLVSVLTENYSVDINTGKIGVMSFLVQAIKKNIIVLINPQKINFFSKLLWLYRLKRSIERMNSKSIGYDYLLQKNPASKRDYYHPTIWKSHDYYQYVAIMEEFDMRR